jgi:co-chaperonin GroES (HSP10)
MRPNKFQPIGKYIAVKDIEQEVTTDSGLVLSGEDANQLRYRKAKVIAPGTDVTVISEGDVIHYDKGHGFTMIIHDQQYTIIQERDVVVVL